MPECDYLVSFVHWLRSFNSFCVTEPCEILSPVLQKQLPVHPVHHNFISRISLISYQNAAPRGCDTYRHGRPCCRRRARRNLRCRTSQRPRSDWFRCTARRTAPSSGGGNCPAAPYRLAAPWGRTVCRADGFSSSGGGEPEPEQRVTHCHADSLSVCCFQGLTKYVQLASYDVLDIKIRENNS